MLQEHHRRQCAGSSKTMFESPNTRPRILHEHHFRVQERPATIAPKASDYLEFEISDYLGFFEDQGKTGKKGTPYT